MNGFRLSLKMFMVILAVAGIICGVIGVFITNFALIVAGAILMTTPLILKLINDMILDEWLGVFFEFLGIAAIAVLYVWTSIISSEMTASVWARPVLWVVVGVGVIQLLLIFYVFPRGQ